MNAPQAPRPVTSETGTVFRHEFRSLFLSWRALVPMGIYAGFGALAMLAFTKVAASAQEQFDSLGGEAVTGAPLETVAEEGIKQILSFTGWGGAAEVTEIFRDQVPLLVLFFFVAASYFLPLLVALVSFDQFSELSTRGARFALLRVRRVSYVVGRALAAVATVSAFLLVMWLVVIAVTGVRGGLEVLPHALREGLRAWLLMTVLALPYLSLTALVSSLARPGLAFVGTLGLWVGLSLGSLIVYRLPEPLNRLLLLFPWESAPKLISRDLGTLAVGVVNLLLIAALGYAATVLVVRRRDV